MKTAHQKAEKRGRMAEILALIWMILKGYSLLERRYRTREGEIDLILKRRKTLVFLEVKTRKTLEEAHACLKPSQCHAIRKAAQRYLSRHQHFSSYTLRFDVFLLVPKKWPVHLENAW